MAADLDISEVQEYFEMVKALMIAAVSPTRKIWKSIEDMEMELYNLRARTHHMHQYVTKNLYIVRKVWMTSLLTLDILPDDTIKRYILLAADGELSPEMNEQLEGPTYEDVEALCKMMAFKKDMVKAFERYLLQREILTGHAIYREIMYHLGHSLVSEGITIDVLPAVIMLLNKKISLPEREKEEEDSDKKDSDTKSSSDLLKSFAAFASVRHQRFLDVFRKVPTAKSPTSFCAQGEQCQPTLAAVYDKLNPEWEVPFRHRAALCAVEEEEEEEKEDEEEEEVEEEEQENAGTCYNS